ncbi:hypothetical protein KKF81_00925 [Candidatus Micrarchaeota archaeon]|nr:hypothetical protein [Candidatus Micrarchaeota archaeon]MBU1165482.1 hypothetical protein [Candidatus Micrarchaeota archaeon]MBU1886320.1 hypothetical protein [Candidatus Micrarchaeota archaeon]
MRQVAPVIAFAIAVIVMYLILQQEVSISTELKIPLAVFFIFMIGIASLIGLFEKSIIKYGIYSAIIQFAYFMLDVSTALLIGKSIWFAVLQLINFIIAGSVFAIVILLLYKNVKKDDLRKYAGLYDKNQFLIFTLVISSLALGGMPGFNIFVGEYLIYGSLFTIHPALTIGAVFAGLLCFLFYFRICYTMFAGTVKNRIVVGFPTKLLLTVLTMLTLLLGLVPQILFRILELYT